MKIPLLILCLAVVYGTCRTYDEENDVTIQNNGDYKNYASIPFEKSLAKHKRSILKEPLSSIISIIFPDALLNLLGFNNSVSSIKDFVNFMIGLSTGQDVCSKVDKLSFNIIREIFEHPVKVIKIIICSAVKIIGTSTNLFMSKLFDMIITFIKDIGLPVVHTILNKIRTTELLPQTLNDMIDTFDLIYKFLQMTNMI